MSNEYSCSSLVFGTMLQGFLYYLFSDWLRAIQERIGRPKWPLRENWRTSSFGIGAEMESLCSRAVALSV